MTLAYVRSMQVTERLQKVQEELDLLIVGPFLQLIPEGGHSSAAFHRNCHENLIMGL